MKPGLIGFGSFATEEHVTMPCHVRFDSDV